MALEHEDIVADSEEEPEEIECPVNSVPLPLQQVLCNGEYLPLVALTLTW